MWHEWGLYLGWLGLGLLVAGVVASRGPRERALKWAGFVMILFVIGGFHQLTPWRVFHLLPLFKSQHVPSRWLYPAVLALACAPSRAASGGSPGRASGARSSRSLLGCHGGRRGARHGPRGAHAHRAVVRESRPVAARTARRRSTWCIAFRPKATTRRASGDVATLPGVLDNVGTIECDTYHGLHMSRIATRRAACPASARGERTTRVPGRGLRRRRAPEGDASSSWTPNEVEVQVDGARAGDHVVMNQNWDPGWTADGAPAVAYRDAVATVLAASAQTVHFRYWPAAARRGSRALRRDRSAAVAFWLLRRRRA